MSEEDRFHFRNGQLAKMGDPGMCEAISAIHGVLSRKSWNASVSTNAPHPGAIIAGMGFDQHSDEDLLAQYRAATQVGERDQALNELFRRHYSRVARWCLRFTFDREEAADLAQEIFTKAYQNLNSFEGQSKFSTWLFAIARNHCLNAIRAKTREATELKADVEEDFLSEVPDSAADPHTALERGAAAKLASELLSQVLDEKEKAVFTLHYSEELPLETVTRVLGLENTSGAKAYIVSAKRKLARALQRWKIQGQYSGL
jgi:RNA polymerase sigma factor (sigma-70 family)